MHEKTKDERLRKLINELLRPMVEEIINEKLRLDPHALDWAGTVEAAREDFKARRITK